MSTQAIHSAKQAPVSIARYPLRWLPKVIARANKAPKGLQHKVLRIGVSVTLVDPPDEKMDIESPGLSHQTSQGVESRTAGTWVHDPCKLEPGSTSELKVLMLVSQSLMMSGISHQSDIESIAHLFLLYNPKASLSSSFPLSSLSSQQHSPGLHPPSFALSPQFTLPLVISNTSYRFRHCNLICEPRDLDRPCLPAPSRESYPAAFSRPSFLVLPSTSTRPLVIISHTGIVPLVIIVHLQSNITVNVTLARER